MIMVNYVRCKDLNHGNDYEDGGRQTGEPEERACPAPHSIFPEDQREMNSPRLWHVESG